MEGRCCRPAVVPRLDYSQRVGLAPAHPGMLLHADEFSQWERFA